MINDRRKSLLPYDGIERRSTLMAEKAGEELVLIYLRPASDRRAFPRWEALAYKQAVRAAHLARVALGETV